MREHVRGTRDANMGITISSIFLRDGELLPDPSVDFQQSDTNGSDEVSSISCTCCAAIMIDVLSELAYTDFSSLAMLPSALPAFATGLQDQTMKQWSSTGPCWLPHSVGRLG